MKTYPEGTKFAVKIVEDGHMVRWAIGDCVEVGRTADGWKRGLWPDQCAVWSDVWRWRKEVAGSDSRLCRGVYVVVAIPPPRPKRSVEDRIKTAVDAAVRERTEAILAEWQAPLSESKRRPIEQHFAGWLRDLLDGKVGA